jgi:hypothetical protein
MQRPGYAAGFHPEEMNHEILYLLRCYDKGKHEAMTEAERHAMFDECLEYDDHLCTNRHVAAEAALQPPGAA